MSPIRITSQKQICISRGERELAYTEPILQEYLAENIVYVKPGEKGPDHTVKVIGFRDAPGGIIESQRLTVGHTVDDVTLTTEDDPELFDELGLSEITIDGVVYTAVNPKV